MTISESINYDEGLGYELFNKTEYPKYGGGSSLILPLVLFSVQVQLKEF